MEETENFQPYRCLAEGGSGEITEKKSRFIATLRPVQDEGEAVSFIEEMKKKYWDASHNCPAYVIGTRQEVTRCSDDGEPSGTAGRPMLEVLLKEGICNAAVVVTRYFGGTLLGTGGLVRAYGQAVKEGLKASRIVTMRYGQRLKLTADYGDIGRIQYLLGQNGISIQNAVYSETVSLEVMTALELSDRLKEELVEATAGRIRVEKLEETYFVDN